MLALPQCQEFFIMFHLKFYQKIVTFLLLHLGFFRDATRKNNIGDDKIPVLEAPWILWNVAVAVQKSLVIELLVQNTKMKEKTRK